MEVVVQQQAAAKQEVAIEEPQAAERIEVVVQQQAAANHQIAEALPEEARKADLSEIVVQQQKVVFQEEPALEPHLPITDGTIKQLYQSPSEELVENGIKSHIRRYVTRPSQSAKTQEVVSDFQEPPLTQQVAKPRQREKMTTTASSEQQSAARQTPKSQISSTAKQKKQVAAAQASPQKEKQAGKVSTAKQKKQVAAAQASPQKEKQAGKVSTAKQKKQVAAAQASPQKEKQAGKVSTAKQKKQVAAAQASPQKEKQAGKVSTAKQKKQVAAAQASPQKKKQAAKLPAVKQKRQMAAAQAPSQMQQNTTSQPQEKRIQHCQGSASRPVVSGGINLFVEGEALLWQAEEDHLTYIYSGNDLSGQVNRELKKVDFSWDFGFRVGLGYNAPLDGWDISLYWTNIRNTAHGSQNASANKMLFPVWSEVANPFNGTINSASAHWRVNLDQVDLSLGREFRMGKRLTFRPFVGLRSDWIYQKYDIVMDGDLALVGSPLEQRVNLRSNFWGFGFAAGFGTNWILGMGFSLFGDADLSIVMGYDHIAQKGVQNGASIWKITESFRGAKPIFDLGLGLKWSRLFCKDSFGLTLKAGYEYHLYFNQNQFLLTNGSSTLELFNPLGGDLGYQGAVGSIQFDF